MKIIPTVVVLASIGAALPAGAAEIVQSAAIAERAAGWADTLTYRQADPAVGQLTAFKLELTGTVGGHLDIENRDQSARSIRTGLAGSIVASLPGGASFVSASPYSSAVAALSGFDGTVDFGGSSGRSITLDGGRDTQTAAFNIGLYPVIGSTTAAPFIGTGSVALPVAANVRSTIEAGGNVSGRILPTAGATGTLSYLQTTPGTAGSVYSGGFVGFFPTCCGFGTISGLGTPTLATTALQTRSVAAQATGWSESLVFDAFDGSLGALWSVDIVVKLPGEISRSITTLDGPSWFTLDQFASLTLARPDGVGLAEVTNGRSSHFRLGDAAVASAVRQIHGKESVALDDDASLTFFTGTDPLTLMLSSAGTSTLSGDNGFAFDLTTLAGAQVLLRYTYAVGPGTLEGTPFADGTMRYDIRGRSVTFAAASVAEPATLALFAAPPALIALRRRRA